MICPFCEKEGRKSVLQAQPGSSTLMSYNPFYDEDGNFHSHDPNTHTARYLCSNGHQYVDKEIRGCPSCDYGRKHTIERIA